MADKDVMKLGKILQRKRESLGLSIKGLAREIGMTDTTVMRMEQGQIASPRPDLLAKLAERLDLSLAELYASIGYTVPNDLPSMPAYLRAKYPDLPTPARKELSDYLKKLKDKYGLDENGPKRGEDEK